MKRSGSLLIVLFLLGGSAVLQGQSRLRFSVHADPQFAWLKSDEENVVHDGAILHVQTGLLMDLFFQRNYAFAIGLGINNLGGKLLYTDSTRFITDADTLLVSPGQTVRHNLQYLDIPLGLKLKSEELGYATFFLEAGFNPMINIAARVTSKDDSFEKENIREETRLFNLGYHVGIGVEYRLGGNTSAVGGVRWSSGLTDVTGSDQANVNTRALSIHLGILF